LPFFLKNKFGIEGFGNYGQTIWLQPSDFRHVVFVERAAPVPLDQTDRVIRRRSPRKQCTCEARWMSDHRARPAFSSSTKASGLALCSTRWKM
jgi:hypothetical protein